MTEREELFEQIDDACEEGRIDEALELLEKLGEDDENRWFHEFQIRFLLADLGGAKQALHRAALIVGEHDPWVALNKGMLAVQEWDTTSAHVLVDDLKKEHFGDENVWAEALLLRARIADMENEFELADRLLSEAAHSLGDPRAVPRRLTPEAFRDIVDQAAKELPEAFRPFLDALPVIIDPVPTAGVVGAPESGNGPDLLGLYTGPPLVDFQSVQGGGIPPTIHLFQRNLEQASGDHDELVEQIHITLYHELAHALGFEEDEVDEMGLG